jgi:ACT domain-containing protein
MDRAGVFSSLSNALFKSGANIITMNQKAPENGLASVSIVIGIDSLKAPINELIKHLELLDGVVSIKNV